MWKRYIIFLCVFSTFFALFTKNGIFVTPMCVFLAAWLVVDAIEEMLQEFDKSEFKLEVASKAKEYATAANIQGYLIGVLQCIAIVYEHKGYKDVPKEISDRLDKIQ